MMDYKVYKLRKTLRGYHLNDLRNAAEQAGLQVWNKGKYWGADKTVRLFLFAARMREAIIIKKI